MITPETIVTGFSVILFSLLFVLASLRLRSADTLVILLIVFTGLGFLTSLAQFMLALDITPLPGTSHRLFFNGFLLAMILTFGLLSLSFLRKPTNILIAYLGVALINLILWFVLALNLAEIGNRLDSESGIMATRIVAIAGWVVALTVSLVALYTGFKERQSAKYLNRLRYWLIATVLLGTSGLILFINPALYYWTGLLLTVIAAVLITYVVLTYHTADLNRLIGRALHYMAVTSIIAMLFYISLAFTIIVSRSSLTPINVFFWAIFLAILLAVITPPLWKLTTRLFNTIIFGKKRRDDRKIIRHYSRRISTAFDMKRLGDTLVDLMIETLGVEQGIVFVNERGGHGGISLRPLSSVGVSNVENGYFNTDSLFIDYFRQNNKYLYQYDIDVLPDFNALDINERAWLTGLSMEIYVPILRHPEFVGLLAFGPSSTPGTSYYEEDIDLMIAMADQAAIAMDSARLFERLATINQEVGTLSEQLAGLDQNKRDFLSIASHELRTPLTHIHGYSRMLLEITEEEAQDVDYVKTIVAGIAKGSDRMKSVIDMMFDVTEANVGEMSLFLGPVDLSEVLDQATRPYLSALDERRIAFGKEGFDDLPIIEADGTRLVQAFENLISNAIKYTPDGGLVKVIGQAVVADKIGSAVQIVVSDTGIGIDPDHHKQIFEKFFRIDDVDHHSTGRTKFKGAGPGLGLTLVKGIAEAHGGKIWVESLGHDEVNFPGSKFYFVIPLHPIRQNEDKTTPKKQSQIETVHWRNKDYKQHSQPPDA